ncbi:PQQ-binding-like beta-propeller repeat protein [Stakelama pacifica]|uniref:Outer membrane protein assembly factor BamB n=1 Tax=Stakelama pacifica TaxID=517720 RepID=A0A4V3BS96_9SPHN|nr:PQQ-binding-like beta-propeller repeat protein [Stakelama pacifica]TDN78558.1 outer membrane protein assembly factor BamB [Stakelama pacifica]GGO99257.1 hypothetical protein GCM10011329_32320 [Stakelama pacifica]
MTIKTGTARARIVWKIQIGSIQSRNTMIVQGGHLFLGTCGKRWNQRDKDDGVYCIDVKSGEVVWFTPTLSDVNEIVVVGRQIIAPTDSGDVFVIDSANGEIAEIYRADSPVFGEPLTFQAVGAWKAFFASHLGTFYYVESGSSILHTLGERGGGFRAGLMPIGSDGFVAVAENGDVLKGSLQTGKLLTHPIALAPDGEFAGGTSISSRPLVIGDKAYIGFARCTYDRNPAVFCVDLREESVVWAASNSDEKESFGNCRTTPVMVANKLVVASAYTDRLAFLSPDTGELIGGVKLGLNVFQQWSSPVQISPHHVAIGRVDGVCSIVDVVNEELVSSISLATPETERLGRVNLGKEYQEHNYGLYPGEPAPVGGICGTPSVSGSSLFVGTTAGTLARIDFSLAH